MQTIQIGAIFTLDKRQLGQEMSYFLASSRNAFALSIFQSLLTIGNVAWSCCKSAFKWIKEVKTNLLNMRLTGVDITVTVTSLFSINFIQNQHIHGK